MDEMQRRAEAYLIDFIDGTRRYHNHKEFMAYTAVALYVGVFGTVIIQENWPPRWLNENLLWVPVIAAFLLLLFIRWQLLYRRWAAVHGAGAKALLARWVHDPPNEFGLRLLGRRRVPSGNKVPRFFGIFFPLPKIIPVGDVSYGSYPRALAKEFVRQRRTLRTGALRSERILTSLIWIVFLFFLGISIWGNPSGSDRGGLWKGVDAFERGDYGTALKKLRPLAERGVPKAQHTLGQMYNEGKGLPRDHAEAAKWFRKAADQGHPPSQFLLGVLYATGNGVIQNKVQAHMWFNLASASGVENAAQGRERVEEPMTSQEIAEAHRFAREWLERRNK